MDKLNAFQQDVVSECYRKKFGVLSAKIGSGKSLMALVLSQRLTDGPILIVCSKSILPGWEDEIKKHYGDTLAYKVVTIDNVMDFKLRTKYRVYLTTVDTLVKCYKENQIDKQYIQQKFVTHHRHLGAYIHYYITPDEVYLNHSKGTGLFYSVVWGCLVVDEAQLYTNCNTQRCQSLGALLAKHRWLLSGTMFDEPQPERVLGYHMLLNAPNKPRSLPDTKNLLKSDQ